MTGCSRFGPKADGDDAPSASYHVDNFTVKYDGNSETIRGASVAPVFFESAKAKPLLGRLFLAEEYPSRGRQVVVVGYRFWQRKLGADSALIGRTLNVNDRAFTVVGVMPAAFQVPSGVEMWVPMAAPAN